MLPELGHIALALAFVTTVAQAALPIAGVALQSEALMQLGCRSARVAGVLVSVSFGLLVAAFVGDDFSVRYVAENSNTLLPLVYKVAATWGAHEGSMLLWVTLLCAWVWVVSFATQTLPLAMSARVFAVLGFIAAGLLAFVLFTSNPFVRLVPSPAEGRDLNPLLQDPGMALHPPMLYMGYVGFSVAFALCIAGLWAGRLERHWLRWTRPWTTAAWVFLTIGIALGSGWAYYELGWGGWWFWDPVENAAFMPWLVGTALVHSLAASEKREVLIRWTVLLAIVAFGLSLLGTFLVRSGVLSSVHSFATDPRRGLFILALLIGYVGGALALYAARAAHMDQGRALRFASREGFILLNTVALVVAASAVLLGTLYPLVLDALGAGKISVGPPYFDTVFLPLMLPVLAAIGVGPLLSWHGSGAQRTYRSLRKVIAISVLTGAALPLLFGDWKLGAALGFAIASWVALATVRSLLFGTVDSSTSRHNVVRRLVHRPRSAWGMFMAHLGLAMTIAGITAVKSYEMGQEAVLAPGQSMTLGEVTLTLVAANEVPGPNYAALRADIDLSSNDAVPATRLHPEKRSYANRRSTTEAAIDVGLRRDVYVALGERTQEGGWVVRAWVKPLVQWIWGGCALMALGGLLAAADRRYRARAAEGSAERAEAGAAALAPLAHS